MTNPDPTRNERQRRWYWNHREHKNAFTRTRYHNLKDAGQCPSRGGDPAEGRILCRTCQNKRNGITAILFGANA